METSIHGREAESSSRERWETRVGRLLLYLMAAALPVGLVLRILFAG